MRKRIVCLLLAGCGVESEQIETSGAAATLICNASTACAEVRAGTSGAGAEYCRSMNSGPYRWITADGANGDYCSLPEHFGVSTARCGGQDFYCPSAGVWLAGLPPSPPPPPPEEPPCPDCPSWLVPYAVHASNPVSCPEGSGERLPRFDTLLGFNNPNDQTATIWMTFYRSDGSVIPLRNAAQDRFKVFQLAARHALAITLIPGNGGFADLPLDFEGYIVISGDIPIGVWAMLGGGGCVPNHWNNYSAEIPVYATVPRLSGWSFPYAIPYYDDPWHTGPLSYRTNLVLTSAEDRPVRVEVSYRPADLYAVSGQTYVFSVDLPARASRYVDFHAALVSAGYPGPTNSEGWIAIDSRDGAAKIVPYLLIQNRDADRFSAGQEPLEFRRLIR